MQANYKILKFSLLVMLFGLIFLSGCAKYDLLNKKDVIAYVNKEPVLASELKRAIALRARQDPTFKVTPETEAEQLDTIINRKLIVQKAMDIGLAREDRFVNTIKSFWEQTLIRDFLEYKKKTFQDYLYATEDEIKKYYNGLSDRTTFKVIKSRYKSGIDDAYNKLAENKDFEMPSCETIGPVGCEDITSDVLRDAHKMPEGEFKTFEAPPYYYLIKVEKKEKVTVEPLETLKSEIEKRIIAQKEKTLLEDWLKEERKKSVIKILPKREEKS